MAEKLDRKKLEEYRLNKEKEIGLRKGRESSTTHKFHILVCGGTACESGKSDEIVRLLREYAEKNGISDDVLVVKTGCFGFCSQGPVVKIMPGRVFYTHVGPEHAQDIIEKHIMKGELLLKILDVIFVLSIEYEIAFLTSCLDNNVFAIFNEINTCSLPFISFFA